MTVRLPISCVQLMKTVLQVDEHSHQGTASVNMKRHAVYVCQKGSLCMLKGKR